MIPKIQLTPQGPVVPTREEIENGLWEVFSQAFGANLTRDARTPQGQLITSLTAMLRDNNDAFVEQFNQFDPRFAYGKWQEALGAIYFLGGLSPSTNSVVQLEFIGIQNTNVPIGTLVLDDNGNEWVTTELGAIDASGEVLVWAKAVESGPIVAAPNTITQIVSPIPDIDRVNNPGPSAAGSVEESRVDYEIRRAESVAANGKNTDLAVLGALLRLDGVIDAYVISNHEQVGVTVGSTNYPMPRNSLLASVVGGDDKEIAREILSKGGTGATFVGDTEYLYYDESLGYTVPPEYKINFQRPTIISAYLKITVARIDVVSLEVENAAKEAVVLQTQSGENRFRINSRVNATAYLCALNNSLGVVDISISRDNVVWEKSLHFGVDEFPVLLAENITFEEE